jgi:hypothetical protein
MRIVENITLVTLTENDGEPTYKIRVKGRLVLDFQQHYSGINYQEQAGIIENVQLNKGDIIRVEANNTSNELIPEGDGFAYARGRWRRLIFEKIL